MSLANISNLTLDRFIKSLADVDPKVGEVESVIKVFLDHGKMSKLAVQVSFGGEDRYYILDGNFHLLYQETATTAAMHHPRLQEVIDVYLQESIKRNKNALYRDRLKGNTPFNVANDGKGSKAIR